jgi:hypothetical protein
MSQMPHSERETDTPEEVVGVIADTHDCMPAIRKAVAFFNDARVRTVFHAGDIVSPFTADAFAELACPMVLVYGNNDGDVLYLRERFARIGSLVQDPYLGTLGGKKIAVTHHPELVDALAAVCDMVFFGHTHRPEIRTGGALVVNPGECCGYLTGVSTVALAWPHRLQARIVPLDGSNTF